MEKKFKTDGGDDGKKVELFNDPVDILIVTVIGFYDCGKRFGLCKLYSPGDGSEDLILSFSVSFEINGNFLFCFLCTRSSPDLSATNSLEE